MCVASLVVVLVLFVLVMFLWLWWDCWLTLMVVSDLRVVIV